MKQYNYTLIINNTKKAPKVKTSEASEIFYGTGRISKIVSSPQDMISMETTNYDSTTFAYELPLSNKSIAFCS